MPSIPRPSRSASRPRRIGLHLRQALAPRSPRGARAAGEPLVRPLDRSRSRAWVAAGLGVLLALAAAAGGALLVHRATARDAAAERARLQPVDAVVRSIDRPTATPDGRQAGEHQSIIPAEAAWTAPDGSPRTGTIDVRHTTAVGAVVTLWVDHAGTPADPPIDGVGLAADAVCAGLAGFAVLCTAVGGALALRLRTLDRRAGLAWAADWARREPEWTGRAASSPDGP
ncbi:hypothetical protein [Kitasatospora sp. NPDC047058]|uniref:Rv1733c family protein n=1 Tax=Kitasatospora sp. NPDC047058 TaxID=3155620 RepID=UPI0033FE2A93